MKQVDFEQRHQQQWERFSHQLSLKAGQAKTGRRRSRTKVKEALAADFPEQYQAISHHLALAKQRRYSTPLIFRLNHLVIEGHKRLYADLPQYQARFLYYLLVGFPSTVRANAGLFFLALGLFLLPGLVMFALCAGTESVVYSLMPYDQVRGLEEMYQPGTEAIGRERQSDTDLMMFCFYIYNNIGISFQTFAGGVLFGLGSLFFLIYNGMYIGAAAGHITQVGFTDTFFPFVVGHGAFELTAIVLSGAAGLKLGWALVAPGNYTRLSALRLAGGDAIVIIYGSTAMLLIAAFLEAFWSSSAALPIAVKYAVGGVLWVLVIAYLSLAGRQRHGA